MTDRDQELQESLLVVSVIVPTVRLDLDFVHAIESLRAQTLVGMEIVIVLDGVEDERRVIPDDPRISVVRLTERVGTPRALNAGVRVAAAPLIARLDADDVAEPDRLARQVAVFRANPNLVLLGSAATLINADGDAIGNYAVPVEDVTAALLRRNPFIHSSVMMRRGALEQAGGYDERCNRMQDYELWLRLAQLGTVANLPDRLVSYRVHPGQHSRRTPAFGPAATAVRASRMQLARTLGRNALMQHVDNAAWTAAQVSRSFQLRRPRYLSHA